jgi:hypothetical protein
MARKECLNDRNRLSIPPNCRYRSPYLTWASSSKVSFRYFRLSWTEPTAFPVRRTRSEKAPKVRPIKCCLLRLVVCVHRIPDAALRQVNHYGPHYSHQSLTRWSRNRKPRLRSGRIAPLCRTCSQESCSRFLKLTSRRHRPLKYSSNISGSRGLN